MTDARTFKFTAIGLAIGVAIGTGVGVALGAGVFVALGSLSKSIAICTAVASALGAQLGMAIGYARSRRAADECPGCGYSVRGLPSPLCPECGADYERLRREREAERRPSG